MSYSSLIPSIPPIKRAPEYRMDSIISARMSCRLSSRVFSFRVHLTTPSCSSSISATSGICRSSNQRDWKTITESFTRSSLEIISTSGVIVGWPPKTSLPLLLSIARENADTASAMPDGSYGLKRLPRSPEGKLADKRTLPRLRSTIQQSLTVNTSPRLRSPFQKGLTASTSLLENRRSNALTHARRRPSGPLLLALSDVHVAGLFQRSP